MIDLIHTPDSNVSIQFQKETLPLTGGKWFDADHVEIAESISSKKHSCLSIFVQCERLDESLYNDPNHMQQTSFIGISRIKEEARKQLNNHYFDDEQIDALIKEYELSTVEKNFGDQSENYKYKSDLKDAIFAAQEAQLYPEIIKQFKEQCKYNYNDDCDEEKELTKKEFEKAWKKESLAIWMPQTFTQYERVYHMPSPINFFDSRNRWQQYFFVDIGDEIQYAIGGSGSSGRREEQGRYAHVFATLAKTEEIPTLCLLYNSKNELKFVHQYDTFMTTNRELSGNYKSSSRIIKPLFQDRIFNIDDVSQRHG